MREHFQLVGGGHIIGADGGVNSTTRETGAHKQVKIEAHSFLITLN